MPSHPHPPSPARRAITTAMSAALRTDPARTPVPVHPTWFHRGMAAATGAAGGAFGLPGTLLDLPVSTTLLPSGASTRTMK